ncbi:bile acid:sodium symporter family protein [Aquibacillus kalidii]|uniref:bile acid:sodium symporter family protein n=1 Tax=Aquibacillus kalidii TaxID=2762597 RepID=UPI001649492C|nr:bile acid:sodium symporter family protein [Aquibacillus kalidii]
MLQRVNRVLERIMPLLAPTSVVVGVVLAQYLVHLSFLVPWVFAFMTFVGSLSSNLNSLKRAVLHPLPIMIALFILHIFMPLWAWGIGHISFHEDILTITGLIIAMVIPTGITSFIWVSISKGNVALTLSIILIDTILSPFLVPYSLSILVGHSVEMEVWSIMKGLVGMIVIPSIVGMCLNEMTKGRVKDTLSPRLAPFSKVGLASVIMINSSVVAPYLKDINWKLVKIATVMFFIAFCGYLISWIVGRLLKKDRDVVVALTFTGGMRNISAGAVIAVAYFPPPVAVPVVIGMLFQQVLASLYSQLLHNYYNKVAYSKG